MGEAKVGSRDCNPGPSFSIPGFGISREYRHAPGATGCNYVSQFVTD